MKFSDIMHQEKDYYSSSSLSTEISHPEAAAGETAKSSFNMQKFSFDPGLCGGYSKSQQDNMRPSLLPHSNSDPHEVVLVEYGQSMAPLSYPHFGTTIPTYAHNNTAIYPHILGFGPERVALPVDCSQGLPIYVNAKQYHAILRRRQTRAKLEAQNKVAKSRKPYLHESRHLHALKRARGSGGRFLNTKDYSKISNHRKDDNDDNFSDEREAVQISDSSNVWQENSNTSGSKEVSGTFHSDSNDGLRGLSLSSFLTAHSSSRVVETDGRLHLSKCSRISTATN